MLNRRDFLNRTVRGSSLVALGGVVPQFLVNAAGAAEPGKDNILVVLELTGGNDGLNTVIPYADDLYHKARPTLAYAKADVVRVDDHIGLNPGMRSFDKLLSKGQLAIVQGVGYPNPERSHFESMDVWQSADPKRRVGTGWLGRSIASLRASQGAIRGLYIGTAKLPLAMQGSSTGVPTVHFSKPYDLELTEEPAPPPPRRGVRARPRVATATPKADPHLAARRKLIDDVARLSSARDDMLQFVQRSALQTYTTIDRLREIMRNSKPDFNVYGELAQNLGLIAGMIAAEFGTRIFYVSITGFDTHADQQRQHLRLLQQVADAVTGFFARLERSGHAKRVLLMTFSEFGRRIEENGSRGTDHGAASCVFVAGPGVRGGPVGKHPSLAPDDLDGGDLKYHTDFRRVYATLLDGWLGCGSGQVLLGKFEHVPLLKS
jgi:uncharacterized protein (DUF1501 family)